MSTGHAGGQLELRWRSGSDTGWLPAYVTTLGAQLSFCQDRRSSASVPPAAAMAEPVSLRTVAAGRHAPNGPEALRRAVMPGAPSLRLARGGRRSQHGLARTNG